MFKRVGIILAVLAVCMCGAVFAEDTTVDSLYPLVDYSGETVKVQQTAAGSTYTVLFNNGEEKTVKTSALKNWRWNSEIKHERRSDEFILNYLTSEGIGTAAVIWVDLEHQFVYTIKDNVVLHAAPIASGAMTTPTPRGMWTVYGKGGWFNAYNAGVGGKYFLRFNGHYMLHGFPQTTKGKILDYTLGKPASHGCIRMAVEDAEWNYTSVSADSTWKVLVR